MNTLLADKVIDLTECAAITNANLTVAKELLTYLIETALPPIEEELSQSFQVKDIPKLIETIHKLHGGVAYCGVPRLKKALYHAEMTLKSGKREQLAILYELICNEIISLKTAYQALPSEEDTTPSCET